MLWESAKAKFGFTLSCVAGVLPVLPDMGGKPGHLSLMQSGGGNPPTIFCAVRSWGMLRCCGGRIERGRKQVAIIPIIEVLYVAAGANAV